VTPVCVGGMLGTLLGSAIGFDQQQRIQVPFLDATDRQAGSPHSRQTPEKVLSQWRADGVVREPADAPKEFNRSHREPFVNVDLARLVAQSLYQRFVAKRRAIRKCRRATRSTDRKHFPVLAMREPGQKDPPAVPGDTPALIQGI